jgi:hypothetical protein
VPTRKIFYGMLSAKPVAMSCATRKVNFAGVVLRILNNGTGLMTILEQMGRVDLQAESAAQFPY